MTSSTRESGPDFAFRPLMASDYPLLLDWLQRPHIKAWWDDGDDTLRKVAEHYRKNPDQTFRFILLLDGQPAGYFQYCRLASGQIGIDQFLANADQLSLGIGGRSISQFIDLIRDRERVGRFSVDPDPDNARAIRCYEKCGFVHEPQLSGDGVHFMTLRLN